jgi:hypothetical protein
LQVELLDNDKGESQKNNDDSRTDEFGIKSKSNPSSNSLNPDAPLTGRLTKIQSKKFMGSIVELHNSDTEVAKESDTKSIGSKKGSQTQLAGKQSKPTSFRNSLADLEKAYISKNHSKTGSKTNLGSKKGSKDQLYDQEYVFLFF